MATTVSLKPNAVEISGSTSGTTTLQATAVAGTTTLTLPAATDTLVGKATTDTLTNKTLTGAAMNGTLGATTPSTVAATTISASSTATFAAGAAGTPSITTSGDTNTGIFFPAADTVAIATSGAEAARIDTNGNLLVGDTSAYLGSRLSVKTGNNNGTTHAWYAKNSSATVLGYQRDDGLFNTGAATNSPYNFTTGSAANVALDASGTLYRSTSSLKYKKNVQDATHGLADLLQLRSVTYEGKAETDTGKTFGGLIAEEVHAVGLTEFVQYAEDGSPDALAYGNMVSLCIKAIQEQQALITTLTARITALEGA